MLFLKPSDLSFENLSVKLLSQGRNISYNQLMNEFHALVPAAGFGARMGHELPKQYLPLAGKPMIFHALHTLCASPWLSTVFVVLSPADSLFHTYDWSALGDKLQPLFCGGATRADTVLNGLLAAELEPDDWVLVHDAARPCLTEAHLEKLIDELALDYGKVIVSNFDIDTCVHPQYFPYLTYKYLTHPNPTHASYQPIAI